MAETITIICPSCEKSIKAPEDVVGKKLRCKGCGETFTAKAPKAAKPKPEAKKGKADDEADEEGAYGMRDEYLGARCPECAEAMGEEDRICLHCGYDTVTRLRARAKKVKETTGGDVFVWLLPGIACAFVFLTMLGGVTGLIIWRSTKFVPFEEKLYTNALDCFILWFVILGLWILWKSGKFSIKRLIQHNKPPEIEEKFGE